MHCPEFVSAQYIMDDVTFILRIICWWEAVVIGNVISLHTVCGGPESECVVRICDETVF